MNFARRLFCVLTGGHEDIFDTSGLRLACKCSRCGRITEGFHHSYPERPKEKGSLRW